MSGIRPSCLTSSLAEAGLGDSPPGEGSCVAFADGRMGEASAPCPAVRMERLPRPRANSVRTSLEPCGCASLRLALECLRVASRTGTSVSDWCGKAELVAAVNHQPQCNQVINQEAHRRRPRWVLASKMRR